MRQEKDNCCRCIRYVYFASFLASHCLFYCELYNLSGSLSDVRYILVWLDKIFAVKPANLWDSQCHRLNTINNWTHANVRSTRLLEAVAMCHAMPCRMSELWTCLAKHKRKSSSKLHSVIDRLGTPIIRASGSLVALQWEDLPPPCKPHEGVHWVGAKHFGIWSQSTMTNVRRTRALCTFQMPSGWGLVPPVQFRVHENSQCAV